MTALMTLVAGTPHFDCRCPNGRIKPFCLALLTGRTGCCCEGSCCSAPPGDDEKGHTTHPSPAATVPKKACCCCKAHQGNARGGSRTAPGLGKVGCQKSLAEMASAVSEPSVKVSEKALSAHLFVPTLEPVTEHDGFGPGAFLTAYHQHRIPPPTDLVTVLQHFLI